MLQFCLGTLTVTLRVETAQDGRTLRRTMRTWCRPAQSTSRTQVLSFVLGLSLNCRTPHRASRAIWDPTPFPSARTPGPSWELFVDRRPFFASDILGTAGVGRSGATADGPQDIDVWAVRPCLSGDRQLSHSARRGMRRSCGAAAGAVGQRMGGRTSRPGSRKLGPSRPRARALVTPW